MTAIKSAQCRSVFRQISEVVFDGMPLSTEDEAHAKQCLVCQAETARYRTIERGLATMRLETASAPADLVHRVMLALDSRAARRIIGPVAVSVSAASAVAVAAGVAIAMRRRHAAA